MSDLGNVKKMFGQELNVSVTNADAEVIASTPRLVPNTLIISSPQSEDKKDIVSDNIHQASLFATDYNGVPVQITHVVKIGNGLYMDKSRAIALGIDGSTLVTDSSSNKLRVETTSLAKASSVSLGVVKTASTCQRSVELFPKLGNMSGISINSDGELFITDQLLQIIYNYINDRIASEIAPLLEVKSDLRLIDNYNIIYYPSTISSVSIQIVGLALNDENNEIGVFNKIQFTSTQDNPLIVTFNIRTDSGYPVKVINMELVSNVYDSDTISNVIMYRHQAENIFFEFYPNLLTQSIDYQITCNIKDNEANMIVEDTVFKFSQQFISSNKNELFSVTSIVIEDDESNKSKITSIQFIISPIIRNYIINDVIPSLTLTLSYKINNMPVNISLDINKDNIDNILVGNESKITNLSGLSNGIEISWAIIANLNMNIGSETNDVIEFNNGLINIHKNSYNVVYLVYYILDNDDLVPMNNSDNQGTLNYMQQNIINDNSDLRHYILRLAFDDNKEYELFKTDRNILIGRIYMESEQWENYYILGENGAWINTEDYEEFTIFEGPLSESEDIIYDDNTRTVNIHVWGILLNKFKFTVRKNNQQILSASFNSNITTELYSHTTTSNERLSNMYIQYNVFKNINDELNISIKEYLHRNFVIANRTDMTNNYYPFVNNYGDEENQEIAIRPSSPAIANLSIINTSELQYYYYFYDSNEGIYCIMPLYDNTFTNGINLYNMTLYNLGDNEYNVRYKTSSDNTYLITTGTSEINYIPANATEIRNKLIIENLLNDAFGFAKLPSFNQFNYDIDVYALLSKYIDNLDQKVKNVISIFTKDDQLSDHCYYVLFGSSDNAVTLNTIDGKPEGIRFENYNVNEPILFKINTQSEDYGRYVKTS